MATIKEGKVVVAEGVRWRRRVQIVNTMRCWGGGCKVAMENWWSAETLVGLLAS